MARDKAYYKAEKKIESDTNHPRIPTTNNRTRPSSIRVFVTPFVDGIVEYKGGNHGA